MQAADLVNGGMVAIKIMHKVLAQGDEIEREIRLLQMFTHPGILTYKMHFETADKMFLVRRPSLARRPITPATHDRPPRLLCPAPR